MRKLLTALIAVAALTGCGERKFDDVDRGSVVEVKNNRGGNVLLAIADRAELAKADEVRIVGQCYSACTIHITLDNACLDPDADIGFHGPGIGAIPLIGFGTVQLAPFYRNGILAEFLKDWQFVSPKRLHQITAQEYVELDPESRICS